MNKKLFCGRCGKPITKKGECLSCRLEEVRDHAAVVWRDLTTPQVIKNDEELCEKYKDAG